MRILFSGGAQNDAAASLKPETRVSLNPVDKADVPTAKWKSPTISTRGNDDTMTGGAMGGARGEQGWSVPKFPPQKDNGLGPGEGGAALGRLLKFKAGEDRGMRSGMRGSVDGGPGSGPRSGGSASAEPWKPRDLSKAGYGGAAAAKNYPEGFVQGVGPETSSAPKSAAKPTPAPARAIGTYGKGAAPAAATAKSHPMGIYDSRRGTSGTR
jgi:hypothetical protein